MLISSTTEGLGTQGKSLRSLIPMFRKVNTKIAFLTIKAFFLVLSYTMPSASLASWEEIEDAIGAELVLKDNQRFGFFSKR